jgi:Integrase core domain
VIGSRQLEIPADKIVGVLIGRVRTEGAAGDGILGEALDVLAYVRWRFCRELLCRLSLENKLKRNLNHELSRRPGQQGGDKRARTSDTERRQPEPGLVHHSDRGFQYAHAEYIAILEKYHMVPSMSRPANPYDNASCESFIKTLKREETYTNKYEDLEHLQMNVEEFHRGILQSAAAALCAGLSIPGRIRAKDRSSGRISKRDDGVF